MKSTSYRPRPGNGPRALRLSPARALPALAVLAGILSAGPTPDTPAPLRQITWIESRVADFTDGQTDPCLYVSNRAHLEPTPGCVEFFARFDVDNNGYYDLGCSDDSGPSLSLYLGSDSGYHPNNRLTYPINAGGNIELADLNLDGYAELIHSGWRARRVRIHWGTPGGPSQSDTTRLTYAGEGEDVCVYDLDKDSYLDIILGSSNGILYIFWGSATGYSSGNVTQVNIGYSIGHNIEVADFDKDGWGDIALSCWTYNQVPIVYWGPGRVPRRTVWLPYRWNNAHGISVADLNRDGWLDIVYTGYDTVVTSYIYLGSDSGFTAGNRIEVHPGRCYGGSAIVDLNDDNWLDIVYLRGNWTQGGRWKPIVYYNRHLPSLFSDSSCAEIGRDSLGASGGFIADLNGDDALDIFVNNMEPNDSSRILWGPSYMTHTAFPVNNDHHGVFREPGNFYDRGYYAYYHSSVFAAAPNGDTAISSGTMSWVADLPPWSNVFMAVRAGNTAVPDTTWTGFQTIGSSGSSFPDSIKGCKYLQYRAKLTYYRPCYLPSLERVDCLISIAPRHDVSVTSLLAPTDTVDSGAVVTPRASVVNYGAFQETTLVRMRIGAGYADSLTRILAPGAGETLSFRAWNANQLGWFAIKCSSAIRTDVNPTNDFVTDSVLVRVFTDAAAESILAPLGTLDSGTVVTPISRIRNLSAHAIPVPTYLTITGGYSAMRSKLLAIGASDTVHFPDWTAAPIGNLMVRCSTGLANDEWPPNDTVSAVVTVRPRIDAAALAILLPAGTLDSGTAVTPVCRIANYGTRAESIPVRLRIGATYEQYAGKVLLPGVTDTISFPAWIASPLGSIAVRCSTALPGDQHNENDTVSSTVLVRVGVDAASVQILSPRGYVDSGTAVSPVVRIANNGTRSSLIPVSLTIGTGYTDTRTKIVSPGASDTVVFANWTATRLGTQVVKCTTQLAGDQHPENDKIVDSVMVRTRLDASSDAILAPLGFVDSGRIVIPVARVTNRSTRPVSLPVTLRISDGYSSSRFKLLGIGASDTVRFAAWTARQLGSFAVRCSTGLAGDMDPVNDTVSVSVTVRAGIDAASVAILAPGGIVDSGTAATPVVRIANNGTRSELIPVRLRIGSTYDTTITKLLARGTQDTVLFPVWTATQLGVFSIRCSTGLANDQNPANDTLSSSVTVRARIDAAALAVLAPLGILDSGTTVIPAARIANYGTRTEIIPVRFQIGSVYAESLTRSLAPGVIDTVSFPAYTALTPGRYVTRCTVGLFADQVEGNNLVVDSFQTRVRLDVGVTTILAPIGSTDSGTVFTPTALVHNYGTRSLTTPVRLRIGTTYNQQTSRFLNAGATDTITFPNWIASPLGTLPVRCSTELTGDENTANDARIDSVRVGVRIDAASIAIIVPTGTIDSGTVVNPIVRIANNGTRSAAILVTVRIGTTHQRTRTKTLGAGVTDTLSLPFWTATEVGTNAIRCSVGLAGDRDRSNDTISSSVLVRARIDAASVAIITPSGILDSGALMTPVVRIGNNGTRVEAVPVYVRIGTSYSDSTVKTLLPGTTDTVALSPWIAGELGLLVVRCSVGLTNDQNPVNDTISGSVTVRSRIDAAAVTIIAPTGLVDSGTVITPVVRIANNGTSTALIPVNFRVGSFYDQTLSKSLAPGVSDTVLFPNWTATQVGSHMTRCSVMLAGDEIPANDTISGSVTVRTRIDAASIAIIAPTGAVDSGTVVTPIARISNLGDRPVLIPVTLTVGAGYTDTRTKIVSPGASDTVVFANWTATRLGTQIVKCTTQLTGDQHPENDKVVDSVTVGVRIDAASIAILTPVGVVDSGTVMNPIVRIANNGTRSAAIPVTVRIGTTYQRTRTKTLGAGVTDTLSLPFWTATEVGVNAIRCSVGLAGDRDPANDTCSGQVEVAARIDAAVTAIITPTGTLDSGATVVPAVRIANRGTRPADVPVRLTIGSTYDETVVYFLDIGATEVVAFPDWLASEVGTLAVRCSLGLTGDEMPANDTMSTSVLVRTRIDAAALAIVAPTGTVDSGAVIAPVVRVANNGTGPALIPARVTIGGFYDQTLSKLLAPGTSDTIVFPDWTAESVGTHAVRCSVMLAADEAPANDTVSSSVTVSIRIDAASIAILAPVGIIDSGAALMPVVRVANLGVRPAVIPVTLTIDSGYTDTRVRTLDPGAVDTVAFADWQATALGWHAVRCTVALAGDQFPDNDAVQDSVLVKARIDAEVVAIIAPTGLADSGTAITPIVEIRNSSSRPLWIPVRLLIGSDYNRFRNKWLTAGARDTVRFAPWTASPLGTVSVRCSTYLFGDENPANDTLADSVVVRARIDAAAQAILAPVGVIDSGTVIEPEVRIANLGTRFEAVPVFLTIGATYAENAVRFLAAGDTGIVRFPEWTATTLGVFSARCSVGLIGDLASENDTVSITFTVGARTDAGIVSIVVPSGTADSGDIVNPKVLVANLGTRLEWIPATLTIGSFYAESTARLLLPGRQDTFRFPSFSAELVGTHPVRCSLGLAGDQEPVNDTASAELVIRLRIDAAPITLIAPQGYLDSGTTVTPRVLVSNNGARADFIPIRLTIGSGYADSVLRMIPAGASDTVSFAPWTATEVGANLLRCTTSLSLDQYPENDLLVDSVSVDVVIDAGVERIFAPVGLVDSGTYVVPRALVRNYGMRPAAVPVTLRIGSDYDEQVSRTILPGQSALIVFPGWTARPVGTFAVRCSTALADDRNPANDTMSDSVTVRFYTDVEVRQIVAPTGFCDSGTTITPCAVLANNGSTAAKFPAYFRIESASRGRTLESSFSIYLESLVVRLAPGAADTIRFADWPANELGAFAVSCSVALSGDRYPDNDYLRDSVVVRARIDAAAVTILAPTGAVDSGAVITPIALIQNIGTRAESIPVNLVIGSDYRDERARVLDPGEADTVCFAPWTAEIGAQGFKGSGVRVKNLESSNPRIVESSVLVRCSTALPADQYPVNDTISTVVTIGVRHDAAVLSIIAPAGEIDSGTVLAPQAEVANLGSSPANIPVTMRIGSTYLQTVSCFLLPQETDTVTFPLWIALNRDTNIAVCNTALPGDTNPENDVATDSFLVLVHDVGATALLAPPARVSAGDTFIPRAEVTNFGNRTATFSTRFRIESESETGLTAQSSPIRKVPAFSYSDSSLVTDLAPGATAEVSFAPWIAEPGSFVRSCSTEYVSDLNRFNDKLSDSLNAAFRNIRLEPDTSCITTPSTLVEYRLRVSNLGNDPDTVDIVYSGLRANWRLELADTMRQPLADHNGNTLPDVGEVGPHQTLNFLVRITTPAAEPAHTVDLTRVRGISGRDSLIWDQVQLRTEIGASTRLTIEPSQEDTTGPGASLTYILYLHNFGNAAEIAELQLVNPNPQWQYELRDPNGAPLPDRNGNGLQDIGPIAPFGTESQFQLRVTPATDARAGTVDSLVVRVFSSTNLAEYQDQANIITWVAPVLTSLIVESDQQDVARPGELSDYELWAEITGNVDDVVDLRVAASQPGWNIGLLELDKRRAILDSDSDSLPDLGTLVPGTQRRFILRVVAPEQANLNGSPDSFGPLRVTVLGTSSRFPAMQDSAVITITLVPNLAIHAYPNPADDKVTFVFGLPGNGKVSLTLYDRATTLVSRVIDGVEYETGTHVFEWNLRNRGGRAIAPGTYYYVLDFTPGFGAAERQVKKLVKR